MCHLVKNQGDQQSFGQEANSPRVAVTVEAQVFDQESLGAPPSLLSMPHDLLDRNGREQAPRAAKHLCDAAIHDGDSLILSKETGHCAPW